MCVSHAKFHRKHLALGCEMTRYCELASDKSSPALDHAKGCVNCKAPVVNR